PHDAGHQSSARGRTRISSRHHRDDHHFDRLFRTGRGDWDGAQRRPPLDPAGAADLNDSVLIAENLTRRFGALAAVDDVSFAIERHAIPPLIGPNGGGTPPSFN